MSSPATPIPMPSLGESVSSATVTSWLKQVGDSVDLDEPLVEVSTDKVDTEIPAPLAGVLIEIAVHEGETVEVGTTIATIAATVPSPVAAPASAPSEHQPESSHPHRPMDPTPRIDDAENGFLSPVVRVLIAEHELDPSALVGSGPRGRITRADVLGAVQSHDFRSQGTPPASVPTAQQSPTSQQDAALARPIHSAMPPTQRLVDRTISTPPVLAERMVDSQHTPAPLTSVVEVDVTKLSDLRDSAQERFETTEGVRLSFLPLFAKATVEALQQHPNFNASADHGSGAATHHDGRHLGIVVETANGVAIPVIRDAGDLNVAGLTRRMADLAERACTDHLSPEELSGGTFTLCDTGGRGTLFETSLVNQRQVAVLGTGTVTRRPTVVTDRSGVESIAIRSIVYFALTYNPNLVDHADAARFLATIKQRIENAAFDLATSPPQA
jgi:pyruvate dehydrogenase E2 component (dihydrolipoamide acetyltransferase)